MRPLRTLARIAAAAAVATLVGCGMFAKKPPPPPPAPPPPPPTSISVTIAASSDVNPDARGRASPVMVKFFELKATTAFDAADFFSLFERDKETLGGELAWRDDVAMVPGDRKVFARPTLPETRFIGVVAAFRDLERSSWRATYALPLNQANPILIRLEDRRIAIVGQSPPPKVPATPTTPSAPAVPAVPTSPR